MTNHDFTLASGKSLHVTPAPFGQANELRKALRRFRELAPDKPGRDFTCDDTVEDAVWACMERATYQGAKITRALMDGDARGDYEEIFNKVSIVNLESFLTTSSASRASQKTEAGNQK